MDSMSIEKNSILRKQNNIIEYFPDKLRVTDLLHEYENGKWVQKVSSYYKIRISRELVLGFFKDSGFKISFDNNTNRMITIIGQKNQNKYH